MEPHRFLSVSTPWAVDRVRGPAAGLFAASLDALSVVEQPTVRLLEPDAPVLVLGSGQQPGVAARGVPVVQRRSGGGAVWLDPATQVWVDIIVPRTDPRWTDDVSASFDWLGQVWASALVGLGVPSASVGVHHGPLVRNRWSPLLCFAGVGPGEVLIGHRKVVGISQRRTRQGALFQCGALLEWSFDPMVFDPAHWPGVPDSAVLDAGVGLRSVLGSSVDVGAVQEALVGELVKGS